MSVSCGVRFVAFEWKATCSPSADTSVTPGSPFGYAPSGVFEVLRTVPVRRSRRKASPSDLGFRGARVRLCACEEKVT